jgi:hypothetical protein
MKVKVEHTRGCTPLSEKRSKALGHVVGLKNFNHVRHYAYGSLCGVFRGRQPMGKQYGNHAFRAIIEIAGDRNRNWGQQPPRALFYLYVHGHAGAVIEVSEDGDIIVVPQMKYVFFAPEEQQTETRRNGWSAPFVFNPTIAANKRRMVPGTPEDIERRAGMHDLKKETDNAEREEQDDAFVL